mmetsp:Transcript_69250/g.156548  ORF Transcript_69250/g.156548 Transcript_69250/m.156548 type:complete len:186 (+) Transcript_69250:57-614(+)
MSGGISGFEFESLGGENMVGWSAPPSSSEVSRGSFVEEPRGGATVIDRRVAPFVSKLHDIVNRYPKVCGFSPEGDTVVVHDPEYLEGTILPIYFRHGNYRSFVRQLNLYEFRKDWNRQYIVYRHPNFVCGRPELLHLIERQPSSKSSGAKEDAAETCKAQGGGNGGNKASSSSSSSFNLTANGGG